MEARSLSNGGCGRTRGGMHEHGEWEVVGGGEAKVLRVAGVRGLRIKKGRKLEFVGARGLKSKQVVVCPFTKSRKQDINRKHGCLGSEKSKGFVFLVVSTKGSEVVDRRR